MERLPLGIQTFEEVINDNKLYIDKTDLIYSLVTSYKYVFLSRPRRFGKSLLTSTFKSYFQGRKDLFKGLRVMDLEQNWEESPVVHLDLSIRNNNIADLKKSVEYRLKEIEEQYGIEELPNGTPLEKRLSNIVKTAYEKTGKKVVILIDEYDAMMLNSVDNEELFAEVRNILNDLFTPLKTLDPYTKFLFLTGISKFSQLSIFSAINNIKDITLLPKYESLCGFTKEELRTDLREYVQALADKRGWDLERAYNELKNYYDGYHFSKEMRSDIFNPFSILNALSDLDLNSYWFDSASPSALIKLLYKFDLYFNKYEKIIVEEHRFSKPLERITDPIPLLFQSGYLSIKGYNQRTGKFTMSYPNTEVRNAFANQLMEYRAEDPDTCTNLSNAYDDFADDDDLDKFLVALKAFYAGFPYTLDNSEKNEKHFHGLLYTALVAFGADVSVNPETAQGKADIVLKMKNTIYVMELKYKRCTKAALSQAGKRDYCAAYLSDPRKVVMVAINFTGNNEGYFKYEKDVVKE